MQNIEAIPETKREGSLTGTEPKVVRNSQGEIARPLEQLYRNALQCQDACNMSGLVISFARDIQDLRAHFPTMGTDQLNRHPICVMWINKLESMSDACGFATFNRAYDTCRKGALGPIEDDQSYRNRISLHGQGMVSEAENLSSATGEELDRIGYRWGCERLPLLPPTK